MQVRDLKKGLEGLPPDAKIAFRLTENGEIQMIYGPVTLTRAATFSVGDPEDDDIEDITVIDPHGDQRVVVIG